MSEKRRDRNPARRGLPAQRSRANARATVGVLAGWAVFEAEALNPFLGPVLEGLSRAAADHDCNLVVGAGIERVHAATHVQAAWPLPGAGSDVVPVGHWNTDALIVIPPLRTDVAWAYVDDLRSAAFPVTFLGAQPNGSYVAIENRAGVRLALEHLVEHGHERVAFIAGEPDDRGDSRERLRAYLEAVGELGLVADERLVAYGMHDRVGGRRAMRDIIASGAPLTAVLASNDQSAIGAMETLVDAGLRIPQDVAVVGFDDQPDAAAHVPSLTTVAYPLTQAGYELLGLTIAVYRQRVSIDEAITLTPNLTRRLSCGCVPGIASSAARACEAGLARSTGQVVDDMLASLRTVDAHEVPVGRTRALCHDLVHAFERSIVAGGREPFLDALRTILQFLEERDDDPHPWQDAVSGLRDHAATVAGESDDDRRLAEDLLHEARQAFSEAASMRDRRHRVQGAQASNAVGRLTAHLLASSTEEQIRAVLSERLPDVGTREAEILLFASDRTVDEDAPYPGREEVARAAERAFPGFAERLRARRERFHLALIPVVFQGTQLGCVCFDASRLEPLGVIARQVGAGLSNAALHAEVLRLSLTDALTGLRNRAYLDLVLEKEIGRSGRYHRPLTLLMFDIDRFKAYNDAYGHRAGDEALRRVAAAAQAVSREADVLARYGGEEFVLVMPETGSEGAVFVAERIRRAIASISGLRRPLTVSVGVATLGDGGGSSAEDLFERADGALYEAKRLGRDRVCLTAPLPREPPRE